MVSFEQVKAAAEKTASFVGGAAAILGEDSLGAAVHAIIQGNKLLGKTIQSPKLKTAAVLGLAAAAWLNPVAVTTTLIASSILKFGVEKAHGSRFFPITIEDDSSNVKKSIRVKQEPIDRPQPSKELANVGNSLANPIDVEDLADKENQAEIEALLNSAIDWQSGFGPKKRNFK